MRVLHVCDSVNPASGGPANVLARLAAVQADRGHTVTVLTADAPADVADQLRALGARGVDAHALGPGSGPTNRTPQLAAEVDRRLAAGVDVVHLHGMWNASTHRSASSCRRTDTPYIIRPCGMLDPWCLNQGRLKKKLFLELIARRDLNAASGLHFTTDAERDLAAPLGLKARPFVIPNGIDWDEFESLPEPGAFRRAHGVGDRPLVVFLSRLHHKKGLDLLLPAFAQGAPADAVLALVGPGEESYVGTLRAQAKTLGIAERTLWPGMLKGAARIEALADADLFCLPSYQENFGVAVVEAAAAGTAVLISDQVNIHADVSDAGAGVVVPCAVAPLAEQMGHLLADRARLGQMGRTARAWAHTTYSWTVIAERIEQMYDAAARPHAAGAAAGAAS